MCVTKEVMFRRLLVITFLWSKSIVVFLSANFSHLIRLGLILKMQFVITVQLVQLSGLNCGLWYRRLEFDSSSH